VPITVDPEQPAGFVTDRDDPSPRRKYDSQQAVVVRSAVCHPGARAAVLVQVILVGAIVAPR
jgi:hypothetical protein